MACIIDHFNLPVSSLQSSEKFYTRCLKIIELEYLLRDGDAIGYGQSHWAFGIAEEDNVDTKLHVAFRADSEETVNRFYQVAIECGGQNNGPPGKRPEYGENYYAAYVLDPDNHNIDIVYRS